MFLLLFLEIFSFARFVTCYVCQTAGQISINCQYGCCGEDDDQSCCSAPYWDWYRIMGMVLGGIVIVAFIIIGLVFLCSYCNKGQRRVSHGVTTVMPVHPPPQPVQPPTYNSLMKNRRELAGIYPAQELPPPYSYENPNFERNIIRQTRSSGRHIHTTHSQSVFQMSDGTS